MLETLFVWSGMIVGFLLAAICTTDLVVGWPFERADLRFDIGFLFSSLVLVYLSYDAKRSNHL